jgi:hypothetical protein
MSPALVAPATRVHNGGPQLPGQQFHLCTNACALFATSGGQKGLGATPARAYQNCTSADQIGYQFDEQPTRSEGETDSPIIKMV